MTRKGETPVKYCRSCFYVIHAARKICPQCGEVQRSLREEAKERLEFGEHGDTE